MNNKYVITVIIVLAVVFTFFATKGIYYNPPQPPNVEYVQGPERTVFVQGKTDTVIRFVRYSGKVSSRDKISVFNKEIPVNESDTVQLSLKTYPSVDSLDFSYFLKMSIRDTKKTDTLFVSQIDTVKTTQIVEVGKPKRFYEQPLLLITAGALAGCVTTIYILK